MHWSWSQYLDTPEDVIEILVDLLNEEASKAEAAANLQKGRTQ